MVSSLTEIGEWLGDNVADLVDSIPNDISKEIEYAPDSMVTITALVCYIHQLESNNESE